MINNERGFAIVMAIMILAILTLIAVTGLQNSITELKIATNHQIHEMEFYGADSAFAVGPVWAEANITPESEGPFDLDPITFSNQVVLNTNIEILENREPISNMPDIKITGVGTHPRKGIVKLEQVFTFVPAFQDPGAPIRSWSDALTIQGNPNIDAGYNLCDDETTPPEVLYDFNDMDSVIEFETSVDCPAGDGVCNDAVSPTPILWANMRENIMKLKTDVVIPEDNGKIPSDFGTEDEPAIVYVDASSAAVEIQGGNGYGILFIDGDVDTISGNMDWHGLVIINGSVNKKLTGTVEIWGALFLNNEASTLLDDDEDLFGNLKVRYDCDALGLLYSKLSGYKPTPSWRYVW